MYNIVSAMGMKISDLHSLPTCSCKNFILEKNIICEKKTVTEFQDANCTFIYQHCISSSI